MPTSLQPLRIAIVGAGKIGSAFAFHLVQVGGHEVTAIARPGSARLDELERDQSIVTVEGERACVRVASGLDEAIPYDLVIVTLLAHQIEPILPALKRSAAASILFMFNTFEPERVQAAIGAERCDFGLPFLQASFDDKGKLKTAIGVGGQKTIISLPRWVDVFNAAGLPARLEPRMPLWLRCHAPFCVAFESVSVEGVRRGGGASWNDALRLARGVRASYALINGLGYSIYPKSKQRVGASPTWVIAAMLWFMSRIGSFRELLATGEAECRALVDVMTEASRRAKPSPAMKIADIAAMRPSARSS